MTLPSYLSGGRIQGKTTDALAVTPTVTYALDSTSSPTSWTTVGTTITMNTGSTQIQGVNVIGATTPDRIYTQLATALDDDNWVVDFRYLQTAIGQDSQTHFVFSAGTGTVSDNQDHIGFDNHNSAGTLYTRLRARNGTSNTYSSHPHLQLALNTQYYVRMIRDGTSLTANYYTSDARTGTPAFTLSLTIPSGVSGLTHIQWDGGTNSSLPRQDWVYDAPIIIWNGVSSVSTAKDKSAITDVPVGTRYEETDTRKIFNRLEKTGGAGTGTTADPVSPYEWTERGSAASSALRGVVGGGNHYQGSTTDDHLDFFTIQTKGNAEDFGNLDDSVEGAGACADATRGVWMGGNGADDTIQHITIATKGDATDFGNLPLSGTLVTACADSTRGVCASSQFHSSTDNIQYVTIQGGGGGADFGDLANAKFGKSACASETRGIFAGGNASNFIEFITILTRGNGTTFGATFGRSTYYTGAACSDLTRGVMGGGDNSDDRLEFITIATTGTVTNFGDLTVARDGTSACADSTRGCWSGGSDGSNAARSLTIDFITIATEGDATDFGDLNVGRGRVSACAA